MSSRSRSWGLIFIFTLNLFMASQLVLYRDYAFEAAWIYVRKALHVSNLVDEKKHGAICNSLERWQCSTRIFRSLAQKSPDDTEVLSNYAIVLAMTKRAQDSLPYFKAYFASGGNGLDVMYWYSRALASLGREKEAIPWLYSVLAFEPQNREAAEDLIELLKKSSANFEAECLMAGLIGENESSELKNYWSAQLESAQEVGRFPASHQENGDHQSKGDYRVPALDGRHFYLPVSSTQTASETRFFVTNEESADTVINENDLLTLNLKVQKSSDGQAAIKSLYLGPRELHDLDIKICADCESKIGAKALSRLNAHIDGRGHVPYLVFTDETEL